MIKTLRALWQLVFPLIDWIILSTPNLPKLPQKTFSGNSHDRRIDFRAYRRAFYFEFYRAVWGGRWEVLRDIAGKIIECRAFHPFPRHPIFFSI